MSDWDVVVHHCDLVIMGESRWFVLAVEYFEDGVPASPRGDGRSFGSHGILEDAVELYLAMYQINPTPEGLDEVLDIILREPMIPWTRTDELTDGPFVLDADTARARKRERIKKHKGRGVIRGLRGRSPHRGVGPDHEVLADSGEEDPVEFLKREVPIDADGVLLKHDEVSRLRQRVAADRERKQGKMVTLRNRGERVHAPRSAPEIVDVESNPPKDRPARSRLDIE